MCKLDRIAIPTSEPPPNGPWRVRSTRPDGRTALGSVSYEHKATADEDAALCNRCCREECTYDVVPDPGGAKIFV